METIIEIRPFRFGTILYEECKELACQVGELELKLNEKVDMTSYIDKVEFIYFTPIIIDKNRTTIHEEHLTFNEEKKTISIQKRVNSTDDLKRFFICEIEHFTEMIPELAGMVTSIKSVLFPESE